MISYYAADERPAWQPTITVNGTADDYSTGFTYEVKLVDSLGTVTLTKTTGITGASGGVITVAWAPNELSIAAGMYTAQLKVSRTADSYEFTLEEPVQIKTRY